MKKNFIGVVFACAFIFPLSVMAQEHYVEGSVSRVLLWAVTPGKMNGFLSDLAENFKPVLDEAKEQGLISSCQVSLNTTKDGPEDWDVVIVVQYKNMAALDGLSAKIDALTLKHYGLKEARQSALDKRVELAHVVGSRLTRQITLKQ